MADATQGSFDLDQLRQLVEMMEQYDLREVKLKQGNQRWVLRRGPQVVAAAPVELLPGTAAPAATLATSSPGAAAAPPTLAVDEGTREIKSPMVGTFYRSPTPGEKPFVKEGDRVVDDTVVCLIEAMKFFNQIKAECSGTIVKVLVNDGDPVEYGQPLFKVKPE